MGCHTYFVYPIEQTPENFKLALKIAESNIVETIEIIYDIDHEEAIVLTTKNNKGDIFEEFKILIVKELPTGVKKGFIPFIRTISDYDTNIKSYEMLENYFRMSNNEDGIKYLPLFKYAWEKYPNGFVRLG